MQMGSRLRPVPERVLECLIEVQAPTADEGAKLLSYYPENYEDVSMLKDVVPFCFPFARDTEMVDAVQHFTFVLTSIDSLYRFGFCRFPPKAKTCLCILSDLPAFELFYGMLNTLAELENAQNEVLSVNQFIDLVLECQVPEPGCQFTVSLPEKDWRNLTDYFSAVDPSNMIALFASMMFERRIIITSKKLSLLTACTYSAASLLYPMHCAPMPFLVGVHSSLMDKVRDMQLDEVVILDVDKNEIEQPFDDLDDIPSDAINKLDSALKKSSIAIGDYISQQFLNAIVVLIGGYRDALEFTADKIVFDRELFVNSRPSMKPFLENLLTLQLFERFIHHRLEQLNSEKEMADIFEEKVSQHSGNSHKWATTYKNWLQNCKRDGSQLLRGIGGKTGKARYKANKFIHASVVNVKHHSKIGLKGAVKGFKEKKKNFMDYVKAKENDSDEEDKPGQLQKCNSLPMRKANGIKMSPTRVRKSIGSSLHDRIGSDPGLANLPKRPHPSNPPPRPPSAAPRIPPRPPVPYRESKIVEGAEEEEQRTPKLRPSMSRNPNDPPVRDLISFYDSQEDITAPASPNPFKDFQEFDYRSDSRAETNKSRSLGDLTCENKSGSVDDLLSQTMISLSSDTRSFLRQSRLGSPTASEIALVVDTNNETKDNRRGIRKTLRELALETRTDVASTALSHSGSCPSLVDAPDKCTRGSPARSDSSMNRSNPSTPPLNHRKSNINHSSDPFLEFITQRQNLKPGGVANGAPMWVADFE